MKVTGADEATERCVSTTLARTKLPVFQGKSVPVQFPLSLYRPPVPQQAARPAAETAPAAPAAPTAITGAAAMPATPPAGTSTAPYVPPSSIQPTPGSAPSATEVKTFIQP